MKHFKKLLAALFCTTLAVTASAQNQATKQGYATAVRVEGNVTYSLGAGQGEHPLVAGRFLPPGSIIYTHTNGVADLILGKAVDLPQAKWSPERISLAHDSHVRGFVTYRPSADQNAIRLTPNSTLAIDKLTIVDTGADSVSDTELDLKKGKIYASVRKLSGASQYLVKLPTGVAGVRGTLFSISVTGEVACYESTGGGVIVAVEINGVTQTFVVQPGFVLDPASTGLPTPVTRALNKALEEIFDALRTTYFHEVDFEIDHNGNHVSKTTGHNGNGKGKGNK